MIIMDIEEMRKAHKFTHDNFWMLQEEQNCRCIYCLAEFSSKEIDEFTMDDTALCPYCWIDTVIGEKSGFVYSDDEAKMMKEFFFGGNGGISEHILDLDLLDKYKNMM